jgi:glucose/arabinose dehydrogenase
MHQRGILLSIGVLLATGAVLVVAQQKDLPAPYATPSADNRPRVVAKPESAKLSVPAKFQVEVWQEGFKVPRFMMLGPGNEVLLSDAAGRGQGSVYVLQGKEKKAIITGMNRPYGLALHDGWLPISTRATGRAAFCSPTTASVFAWVPAPGQTSTPERIRGAPQSTATTPMAAATKSTRRAHAIRSACGGIPERT